LKRLIVNADDFGFTRDVNAGIVEAYRKGVLTAATLMADSPAFDDAVRLARQTPSLDVGCHLVLVGMPGYPASVSRLIQALALRRVDVYGRLKSQIGKILDAGVRPSHIDTHKHTHLLPPVLDAVARLAEEFGILWVRQPFDFDAHPGPSRRFGSIAKLLRPRFRRVLSRHGLRSTDHFAGFRVTGALDSDMLVAIIDALPEGTTEFMCHPGFCTSELRQATTRLKDSRERELGALTDPRVREAIHRNGVALTTYRDLF
jgi:chitin disaccharide deacetylase